MDVEKNRRNEDDRRKNHRHTVENVWVEEQNGDFVYQVQALELSESGVFLRARFKGLRQKQISRLALKLNSQDEVRGILARPLREEVNGRRGIAYQFINLDEEARIRIRMFLSGRAFDEYADSKLILVHSSPARAN